MMGKKWGIFAVVILCACTLAYSDILFEDPFDTKDNWAKANSGTCTENIGNGLFTIQATTFTEYKHSRTFQDFTYSMKIRFESSLATQPVGILFCLQGNLEGYMFSLSANNQYNFGKFIGTSYTGVIANWNSFIDATPNAFNTLKVSKKGGELSFFCNDVFLEKITDAQFGSGDIGFAVGQGEKGSFDHARVIDTAETGTPKTWFSDDFEDGDLRGWRRLTGDATATAENGVMKIPAGTGEYRIYTNGSYRDMPCTTIVEHKSGTAFYGIVFMRIQPGQNVDGYFYLINNSKQFSVFSTSGPVNSNSNIHGTKDTLIVTKDYEFIVNDHLLDDTTFDAGLDFNAVGVCVHAAVSVEFDNFRVGVNDGTPIIYTPEVGPLYTNVKPSYLLGGTGIIYDIRGRKVASFRDGYKDKLNNLSAGSYYIVIPHGNKNHTIRRAIIKTQ